MATRELIGIVTKKIDRRLGLGQELLAIAPASSHPGDYYLWVVLVESDRRADSGPEKVYSTHGYNEQDNGLYEGHYDLTGPEALADFKRRIRS